MLLELHFLHTCATYYRHFQSVLGTLNESDRTHGLIPRPPGLKGCEKRKNSTK